MCNSKIDLARYNTLCYEDFLLHTPKNIEGIANSIFFDVDTKGLTFSKVRFSEQISFKHIPTIKLRFIDCLFCKKNEISDVNLSELFFNVCLFENGISITNAKINKLEFINNQTSESDLSIYSGEFGLTKITGDWRYIYVKSGIFEKLDFHGTKLSRGQYFSLQKLNISFTKVSGLIIVQQYRIKKQLYFTGEIAKETRIQLREIRTNSMRIWSLFNTGQFRVWDVLFEPTAQKKASFIAKDSDLGKMTFFDVDFKMASTVSIKNCYLIDLTFVNVTWPSDFGPVIGNEDAPGCLDLKETYRQLKHSYSKQGDSILEHKFHALEMHAHIKCLMSSLGSLTFENSLKNISSLLILCLSRWTSNFGLSISRPLIIMTLFCGVLFSCLVSLSYFPGLLPEFNLSFDSIMITLANFINFLNPLRRLDTKPITAGLTLDVISRIIVSYCIYNFIRATRRFVK